MAKLSVKFEVILPKDKKFPQGSFDKWDAATTVYFNGPLRSMLSRSFEETVSGWNHKPSFKATFSTPYNTRKQLIVEPVGRYKLNWCRVSEGTRSRSIFPRAGNTRMTFIRFYEPHTYPGGNYGGPGSDYGPTVHPSLVNNHSIAARHFTKEIAKGKEEDILNDLRAIALKVFR